MIALGFVRGRIELDQHVTCPYRLPILHLDRTHHPGLERLDHLDPAARQDLSARGRNDVDAAPPGPDQRRTEQRNDDCTNRALDWRGRRFHDFKRRRQECQFIAAALLRTPERNDACRGPGGHHSFSRLHGIPLATDATMHSGRRF